MATNSQPEDNHDQQPQENNETNDQEQTQDSIQNTESQPMQTVSLEQQIGEFRDKWMRAAAEVENIKRRSAQEIEKARAYSIESLATDLIGVLDNLFRASESISEEDAAQNDILKNAKEGIEITKKEMLRALERHKIKRICPGNGDDFDHNFHQAVSQLEVTETAQDGKIINAMQAGYIIKDRLLRPAMVVVGKIKS